MVAWKVDKLEDRLVILTDVVSAVELVDLSVVYWVFGKGSSKENYSVETSVIAIGCTYL
jgi:hypothetical protein